MNLERIMHGGDFAENKFCYTNNVIRFITRSNYIYDFIMNPKDNFDLGFVIWFKD